MWALYSGIPRGSIACRNVVRTCLRHLRGEDDVLEEVRMGPVGRAVHAPTPGGLTLR